MKSDRSLADSIWADDLLRRRPQADEIQAFLISRSKALTDAGRPGAFTLAIDAEYGKGKSYLLKRLFEQVSLDHPTAFIDAWADDTIDAPWTALLVAIEEALKPYAEAIDRNTRKALKAKGVQLITALAKGAAKKGASYIVGEDAWDEAVDAVFEREAEEKIDAYRERRAAILQLKTALADAIRGLHSETSSISPPLFVFVDELDRCRPTYAVRFLEEIKHIFDVAGVVFIFAVNENQLMSSVQGLYGSDFDARSYLRRFIDQKYVLYEPDLLDLIRYHIRSIGLPLDRFESPAADVANFIASSLVFWDVSARDAVRTLDSLATCEAVLEHRVPLRLELLLPLVIQKVLNIERRDLQARINNRRVPTYPYSARGGVNNRNPDEIFQGFWGLKSKNYYHFQNDENRSDIAGAVARIVDQEITFRKCSYDSPILLSQYPSLVQTLNRLTEA